MTERERPVTVHGPERGPTPDPEPSLSSIPMSTLLLGVASVVGNALSYGFSLVLSRALGPADFGALGALLGLSVVVAVPAAGLQTQVARLVAIAPHSPAIRRGYRLGWVVGSALALGMAALALPLSAALRLDGALAVVLLGAGLVPVIAIGARQGVLLGRGAFTLLAVVAVAVPGLRLLSALVAAGTGMGVSGALGLQSVASWLGLVVVIAVVRALPPGDQRQEAGVPGLSPSGLLAASAGLLGLFVLANADVLLARVFLNDIESGIYAVGAIGTKVVFWGSQFVALAVFPRVARGGRSLDLVLRAAGLVALIGAAGALASLPLAAPTIRLLVGPDYDAVAAVAPWFVVLGTMLALVQLFTYAAVAADRHRFSMLMWATVVVQVALIGLVTHGSIGQIVGTSIAATGQLAVAGAVALRRQGGRLVRPPTQSS